MMRYLMSFVMMLYADSAGAQVRIDHWLDLPGYEVTDTLSQAKLDRPPDVTRHWERFEAISRTPDDALVVSAFVHAPSAGAYRFMIAGDDTALLFVSTHGTRESLKQVALVPAFGGYCDFTRYAAQTSEPIELIAGQRCLVMAVLKNGGEGGHVEVGWELPGGRLEAPIPAIRIETPKQYIAPPAYGAVPAVVQLKPGNRQATAPGQHKYVDGATIRLPDKSFDMSYLIHLPTDFDRDDSRRPLLVFLHGNSHQGRDLAGVLNQGPAQYLNARKDLREWFPMIALVPQLPHGWRWDTPGAAEMTAGLIHEIIRQYPRIDPERVYLTGLSMGGKGTWLVAYASPNTFAAIAPISSVAVKPDIAVPKLQNLYTWIICGENDHQFTQGSKEMHQTLSPLGEDRVRLTVVPRAGHGCWDQFYPNRSFYEDLMQHRRDAGLRAGR